ncbi:FAD-binding protein [Virgibacillus halophilus]|uniref:FAD-binding protein n=1 Tax=Tigheibacillus halophilus TaxID=361280 RepID=A0ABU5C2J8_9BACI|nr:FAD-binding protein [Virgibacillus halophilus]
MRNSKNVFDLVVIGTGNAALCAAIAAKENGANVLMVEKGTKHKRGGNSFFTDGAIRFAYNDMTGIQKILTDLNKEEVQHIVMPIYTEDDYYADIMRVTKNKSEPELARQLVSNSFETIQWMKEQGVQFELNENQSFEKDGKLQFWGGLPIKTRRKGIGLIETLIARAEEMGVEIIYETRAVKLKKAEGKISGLIVIQNGAKKDYPCKNCCFGMWWI